MRRSRPGSLFHWSRLLAPVFLCATIGVSSAQESVTIATYGGDFAKSWRETVAEPFEKSTEIKTEIFETPSPASAVESSQGRPTFQLAITAGYSANRLAAAGKVEELDPKDIPNLAKIPPEYLVKAPSGRLAGIPVNFEYLGIAYNTDMAKPSDFSSWNNLLDPKWKDQISMSRASYVAAYDLTLYSILNGGNAANIEPGLPKIKELASNVLSVYTSMSNLEAQLGRGEVVAAPFYSGNVALLKLAGVKNIDMVRPKEGGLLLPYLLVIPKGASNLDATKKLLNEILTPDYQRGFVKTGAWPVNPEAELSSEDQKLLGGTLKDVMANTLTADWGEVAKNLPERTRMVEEIIQTAK
ncbi:extracellular solute-binding protein [Rhodoligotrophos ferricapiens]|uniref:extracellular solute-binding protein n=1 Tax=Rhodoligotrophos ferricapiens TaxID=3069264 RepID=UPI00315DBAA7